MSSPVLSQSQYAKSVVEDYIEQQTVQAGFSFRHIVYRYAPIRDFFRSYVLEQDLSHIRESRIDEFLMTSSTSRKLHLGRWLLAEASQKTADDIKSAYTIHRRAGQLHPDMPKDAGLLVLFKLGNREQRNQLVEDHEDTLKRNLGLAA